MSEETEVIEVPPAVATDTAASPDTATATDQEVVEPVSKTFTQAELDVIVQKEKAKAERKAARAYREGVERVTTQPQAYQAADTAPRRDAYASDEDWLDARDAHRDAKRDAEQATARQWESQAEMVKTTNKIYADAEKIVGFDREAFDDLPLTPAIVGAIVESDIAPKLMAHMAANPDDVERIAALSPARQAVEIGKLEVKLATAEAKTSKAPAPIAPIGASRGGVSKDPAEMTDKEFAAWRKSQIKQRN